MDSYESILPKGVSLHEYNGDGLLSFPTNVGYGPKAIQAKKPLIVMIENPIASMNEISFLLPLTSSGNLMFSNAQKQREELNDSIINQKCNDRNKLPTSSEITVNFIVATLIL